MDIKAIMNLDLLSVILPEDHSSPIGDLDYFSFGTCEVDVPEAIEPLLCAIIWPMQ